MLLKDTDIRMKQKAALALANLAYNETNKDAIRESQGILSLIALLKDSDQHIKNYAAIALGTLADNSNNRDAIRESRGIVLLIPLLEDWGTRDNAVRALWTLADNYPLNQAMIIDNGAVPLLSSLASIDENARKTLEVCQLLIESRQNRQKNTASNESEVEALRRQLEDQRREKAQCHGLLRHPNTVMLFGVCVEPGRYSLVILGCLR